MDADQIMIRMGGMRLFSRVVKSRQAKKDKFFRFKTIFMIECLAFVYAAFVLTVMPGASEQKFAQQNYQLAMKSSQ
ncbi:MAG: hypothetical protein EBS82_04240 [Methylocystaceae bacterium]|jgi:hypothetical protein|nr:hypothetical protein [Methylocystaceae bacterium]NBT97322.1 hypothetical protein [Methylocystaceae bacterium]